MALSTSKLGRPPMLPRIVRSLATICLVMLAVLPVACNLHFERPGDTTDNGIPFIYQETLYYCVPACIQMAGRFYGLSVPTQGFLYQDMHGSTNGGGIN